MKSVLIVDDSSYYRSRGAEIASRAGYKCHYAENGEQAVRMYRICTKFPGAKVLICSSVGEVPVYKRQAFANGACGVLPKEYDLDDLEFAISEIELMNEEN